MVLDFSCIKMLDAIQGHFLPKRLRGWFRFFLRRCYRVCSHTHDFHSSQLQLIAPPAVLEGKQIVVGLQGIHVTSLSCEP